MADETETAKTETKSETKTKRASKSARLHIRRLKQAARKAGTVYRKPA